MYFWINNLDPKFKEIVETDFVTKILSTSILLRLSKSWYPKKVVSPNLRPRWFFHLHILNNRLTIGKTPLTVPKNLIKVYNECNYCLIAEVNTQNLDFATSSQKYNSSFTRKTETPDSLCSPKSESGLITPIKKPDGRSSLDALTSPQGNIFNPTNAAKEIMNHHESKARLIRDNSCDSISDEVFNNRHRIR